MGKLNEVTLSQLRARSDVKQSVVALMMSVQEPAVSKMERRGISNTTIAKLEKYVDAIGGSLDVTITLPDGSVVKI